MLAVIREMQIKATTSDPAEWLKSEDADIQGW